MGMDLTYLSTVKRWLTVKSSDDDALLGTLLTQTSGSALNYLQRPTLARSTYTELRDGVGNQRMVLRNWPVVSVSSLKVNGASGGGLYYGSGLSGTYTVPPATSFGATGYTLATWDGTSAGNPQEITLTGYTYARGRSNVQFVYDAGYCVVGQPATVDATAHTVNVSPNQGSWCQDDGVSYASGAALTKVAASPATGQYTVLSNGDGSATYGFNVSDASAAVLVSFSFVPAALEQAVVEWIGERYRYKDRIGQKSKSLGGNETASYDTKAMPDFVRQALDQYAKFLPV